VGFHQLHFPSWLKTLVTPLATKGLFQQKVSEKMAKKGKVSGQLRPVY